MIEVVKIEDFVINVLYVPNTKVYKESKVTGKDNLTTYIYECETVERLRSNPESIIQILNSMNKIKKKTFKRLKDQGGVKWHRYLDMSNPVIRWVNENLEECNE